MPDPLFGNGNFGGDAKAHLAQARNFAAGLFGPKEAAPIDGAAPAAALDGAAPVSPGQAFGAVADPAAAPVAGAQMTELAPAIAAPEPDLGAALRAADRPQVNFTVAPHVVFEDAQVMVPLKVRVPAAEVRTTILPPTFTHVDSAGNVVPGAPEPVPVPAPSPEPAPPVETPPIVEASPVVPDAAPVVADAVPISGQDAFKAGGGSFADRFRNDLAKAIAQAKGSPAAPDGAAAIAPAVLDDAAKPASRVLFTPPKPALPGAPAGEAGGNLGATAKALWTSVLKASPKV